MRLGELPTNTRKIESSWILINLEYTFNASHYDAITKSLNLVDSVKEMAFYKRI